MKAYIVKHLNRFYLTSQKEETNQSRRSFFKTFIMGSSAALIIPSLTSCTQHLPRQKRPYKPKYNTIAHKMLDIELMHLADGHSYQLLDNILYSAAHLFRDRLSSFENNKQTANKTLSMIHQLLAFFDLEYQANCLLSVGLGSKKIDCDGYSALYLAIGEVLGLPIDMVRAPAHAFVRWRFDDNTYMNWETTIGSAKNDVYYIQKHRIAKKAKGYSALRSLNVKKNRDAILANSYVNCGVEWLKKMNFDNALFCFDEAISRDILYEAPYYNKGLMYFYKGDMNNAVVWCQKAVDLNPNHIKSHAILGTAYKELKDADKAKTHFRKVRQLDPEYYAVKIMEMQLSQNASLTEPII